MAACLAGGGCSSIVSTHRRRIEKICDANSELADISSALDDIAQTLLYAGRIHDPPLADLALDVAITIHGEPDDLEKAYAQTITPELIKKDMSSVKKLLVKRDSLTSFISSENKKLDSDIVALAKIETKYAILRGLIWKCAIAGGVMLIFLCIKLFFH
jgi:hypothetical protein